MVTTLQSSVGMGFVTTLSFFCLSWTLDTAWKNQTLEAGSEGSAQRERERELPTDTCISNERPQLPSVFQMKTSVHHLRDTEDQHLHQPPVCWERSQWDPPAGTECSCNPAVLGTENCSQ